MGLLIKRSHLPRMGGAKSSPSSSVSSSEPRVSPRPLGSSARSPRLPPQDSPLSKGASPTIRPNSEPATDKRMADRFLTVELHQTHLLKLIKHANPPGSTQARSETQEVAPAGQRNSEGYRCV